MNTSNIIQGYIVHCNVNTQNLSLNLNSFTDFLDKMIPVFFLKRNIHIN